MTFLNPTFLFALFASAIPILIHIFNLRRLKTVEFSSVKFLKELEQSRIRSLKIKQIVLLVIRIFAIVFLVFAFSRPVIKGYLFNPIVTGQAKSSVIIILDNTLSMALNDEEGRFIDQAKLSAHNIVDILSEADEFALIRLSDLPNVSTDGFTHNVSVIRKLIDETEFTYTHKKLYDALVVASEMIERSKNLNREIYIISDFQKSGFAFPSDTISHKVKFASDVRVFLINIGKFTEQNLSVDRVELKNKIVSPKRALLLESVVSNHEERNISNYVVGVFLNEKRVAQKSVNFESKSSQVVDFNILIDEASGFIEGFIEIEDDNFAFDNRRYFALFIPEEIKILLVGNEDDVKFLKIALSTIQEVYGSSFFKINQTPPQFLSQFNFSEFDVVLLVKPIQIDKTTSERLKNFVSKGGALILFVGNNANFHVLNQNFNSVFNLPEFEGLSKQRLYFSKIDVEHPIFDGVFADKPQKLDSPEIREYVKFKANYGFTSIIELADGNPFLVEKSEGSGKVVIFTVEPGDRMSDLPYKGIFIPLVLQSILYTAIPHGLKFEYSIGDTAEVKLDFIKKFYKQVVKDLKLVRPDGSDFAFKVEGNFITIDQTTIPGIYSLLSDRKDRLLKIAFNPPSEEFKYEKESKETIESFLNRFGLRQYKVIERTEANKVGEEVLKARYGVELWKLFLVLSILMFLIEGLISRKM